MARIRHLVDQETEMPIRLTGGLESPEAFPESGEKVVDDERAAELTDHPLIELVDDELPNNYETLQRLASAAETGTVSGNDSEAEIVRHLSGLSPGDLAALAEKADVDPAMIEAADVDAIDQSGGDQPADDQKADSAASDGDDDGDGDGDGDDAE